jgi:hypothetical protein
MPAYWLIFVNIDYTYVISSSGYCNVLTVPHANKKAVPKTKIAAIAVKTIRENSRESDERRTITLSIE